MSSAPLKAATATTLIVALALATAPSFASALPATLTGTVYADDVKTPVAGATIIVTDVTGAKVESLPTAADGAFAIGSLNAGRNTLTLQTKDGSFAVATPVTLAPGSTVGVLLALKAASDPPEEEEKKRRAGGFWTRGPVVAMTAVLVGFAAAAVVNNNGSGGNLPAVSPSVPEEK